MADEVEKQTITYTRKMKKAKNLILMIIIGRLKKNWLIMMQWVVMCMMIGLNYKKKEEMI